MVQEELFDARPFGGRYAAARRFQAAAKGEGCFGNVDEVWVVVVIKEGLERVSISGANGSENHRLAQLGITVRIDSVIQQQTQRLNGVLDPNEAADPGGPELVR